MLWRVSAMYIETLWQTVMQTRYVCSRRNDEFRRLVRLLREAVEISFAVDSADHAQTHRRRNPLPPVCKRVFTYTRVSGVDRETRWMFMTRLRAVAPSFIS